jgi:hypothetical protein
MAQSKSAARLTRSPAAAVASDRQSPPADEAYYASNAIELGVFLEPLFRRWRSVALVSLLAALAAGLAAKLLITPKYRSEAVIIPVDERTLGTRMAGVLGNSGLGALSSLTGLMDTGGKSAEEYISILESFDFTNSLIEHHRLQGELLRGTGSGVPWFGPPDDPRWKLYRLMKKRFDARYLLRSGSITLSYTGPGRFESQRILGFYIDDLRERLRRRETQDSAAAVESLQEEVKATPDPMLQAQLYQLVAAQIQKQKTAQVEADFAFRVIEPPTAPDWPAKPTVALYAAVGASFSFLLLWFFAIVRDWEAIRLRLRPLSPSRASAGDADAEDSHPE